jgi:Flp pilus assembly protein TadG
MAPRARRITSSRDDGAAAVEFALVSLLLLTILFGIIEFSLLMRNNVSVSSAVRAGARVASAGADSGPGDPTCYEAVGAPPCTPTVAPALAQDAASAVQRTGLAMPKDQIDELWVYKANAQGFPGTATSMDTAVCDTNCIRFRWQDSKDRFVYAGGAWNSSTINACVGSADSVGVYMRATHKFILGLFGTTTTMRDRAVMQFEPLRSEECAPGTHP